MSKRGFLPAENSLMCLSAKQKYENRSNMRRNEAQMISESFDFSFVHTMNVERER
jgi:hypothetical protein